MSSRRRTRCSHEGCGSRRFHEGDDGFTYCDQGHQQADRGTQTAVDTGELILEGRKHKRSETGSVISRGTISALTGPQAFEHYLLCLQLVIWKQVRWLIDARKLPAELETLTRDLWTLRLQQVTSRVSHNSEIDTETATSQVFSSQSEGEDSASSNPTRRSKHSSKAESKESSSAPNLLDAAALSYLSLLLLREPVTVADFYSWMRDGKLLYHHAAREVPLSMRERLPGTYQERLEPSNIIRPGKLQRVVQSLINTFSSTLGMAMPQINYPLILYRWTRELMLPIECYTGTRRLARLLEVNFSFIASGVVEKLVVLRSPEVRLMALLVVATKLFFPFDDIHRYPSSTSDLSALKLDWAVWASTVRAQESNDTSNDVAQNLNLLPAEVQTLSDERLDDYLNWYESSMASEDIRSHTSKGTKDDTNFRRSMFELFPASNPTTRQGKGKAKVQDMTVEDEGTTQALRFVQASLKPKVIVPAPTADFQGNGRDVSRAGSFYKQYRYVQDLPRDDTMPVKLFYELAADKAGVELDDMVRAVFAMEKRLEKVEGGLKGKAKASNHAGKNTQHVEPEDDEDT